MDTKKGLKLVVKTLKAKQAVEIGAKNNSKRRRKGAKSRAGSIKDE